MFEDLIRQLDRLDGSIYNMDVPLDEEGYVDKECPSEKCLFTFKILGEDWRTLVRDEEVFCPLCRHSAPADQWFTTEQIEHAKKQAFKHVQNLVHDNLTRGATKFNSSLQRKGFISISMSVQNKPTQIIVPISAAEIMRRKVTCEQCICRFAIIGAAFFCPSCGYNSAESTFEQSVETIRQTLKSLDDVKSVFEAIDKDFAQDTVRRIIENSMQNAVSSFQSFAEAIYMKIPNTPSSKRNVFQRIDDGSELWKATTGVGYNNFISSTEIERLKRYFQQRHLLAHKEGLVDENYIQRSGDTAYAVGQRLVIKKSDVLDLVDILEKLTCAMKSSLKMP